MSDVRYFVLDENTLGYVNLNYPNLFGVLHGSVLKGGHDWKNGPVWITERDRSRMRDATLEDFEEYRVSPTGHLPERK